MMGTLSSRFVFSIIQSCLSLNPAKGFNSFMAVFHCSTFVAVKAFVISVIDLFGSRDVGRETVNGIFETAIARFVLGCELTNVGVPIFRVARLVKQYHPIKTTATASKMYR